MPTRCRRAEGDAQGATIYTLSDKASDAEAQRLADAENRADAIAGFNLAEEPTDVADILIDLTQRETRTFSSRFARLLMGEMKSSVRMHKHPLKSAGFRVLKAPDVPSVLVEIGYVSNKGDLEHLVSEGWRSRPWARWRRRSTGSWPSGWRRPDRRIDDRRWTRRIERDFPSRCKSPSLATAGAL